MNFWEFADAHPYIALLIGLIALSMVSAVVKGMVSGSSSDSWGDFFVGRFDRCTKCSAITMHWRIRRTGWRCGTCSPPSREILK